MRAQLTALRATMAKQGVDYYLIPTDDFHSSEYVGEYFTCREYVSGFTGSAGTLVVSGDWAGLWTDGRYFIQAADQLKDSGIELCKMGEPEVPTVTGYLKEHLQPGMTLGFDGRTVNASLYKALSQAAQEKDAKIAALEQQIADTAAYTEGRLDYMKGVDAEKMKLIESQEKNRHELFLDQSKKMRHKDRVILFLAVMCFIFAAILIYFFVYDTMHPEIGYLHNGLSAFLHGIINCSVFGVIP